MAATAHMRGRAKGLRRSMTVSEQRLWNWLRNRTLGGFKFRRQVPVGRYVLDFYCPALKLAIEVDGQQHETLWMAEYDGERTLYLRSQGIEVVRITNKLLANRFADGGTDSPVRHRNA
ncbi:MAG TPA: endonuclease domain-containing protein [Thermoanaerobaculia bacterium]|nr:endonuclease domain-containing protein [Thermoanaerobaculia bacterium]